MAPSHTLDLNDVAEVVAFDQALTLRLLRAANSAALGGTERLSRAIDAVFRLGVARVLSLAVAGGVRESLQRDVAAYGLAEGELWRHSVAAAAAAEMIVEACPLELPPETFTAALLHDVGKLVMGRHLSAEDLEWIHRSQIDGRRTPLDAEHEILARLSGFEGSRTVSHCKSGRGSRRSALQELSWSGWRRL
jgi:HD-like signal output (HDOD) protein